MNHFLVFGSHPFLSLAEARAVISGERPMCIESVAFFDRDDWNGESLMHQLGGTVKLGDIDAELLMSECLPEKVLSLLNVPDGKIEFGFTVYGGSNIQKKRLGNLPLALKRLWKEQGRSVRWVTGEHGEISPTAVQKTGLAERGTDFIFVIDGDRVFIGHTTHVQDADAWSKRDFGRPFRDEVVGMLPPKLARMMVNLSLEVRNQKLDVGYPPYEGGDKEGVVLDPFCGSGTILMEANLLGIEHIIGSDIDQKQIQEAKQNIAWLREQGIWQGKGPELFLSRAEELDKKMKPNSVQIIVTEGHLGKPLAGSETMRTLEDQKNEIEGLWRNVLKAFAKIQPIGGMIVCVWPVFVSSHGTVAVDLNDEVESFGYKKIDPLFEWVDRSPTLTYARPGQRVKRNIIILKRVYG